MSSVNGAGYKRASRKGAPRKYKCQHPGCDKIYSRAEHLQRHQLNHNPKEIFQCDVGDCDQKFVRLDLLARHKKRHTSSYTPRNRIPSFDTALEPSSSEHNVSAAATASQASYGHHPHPSGPHDAAMLLTPESNAEQGPASLDHGMHGRASHQGAVWPTPMDAQTQPPLMHHRGSLYASDAASMPEPAVLMPFAATSYPADSQMSQGNFAAWLFDPQTTAYGDFIVSNLPFLDGGLESTFNNTIQYDYESLHSRSPIAPTPPRHLDAADEVITEARRNEILQWFQKFRQRRPRYEPLMTTLTHESGGDLPSINVDMLRECVREFWDHVSPRLPIVHQPTFSASQCSVFLLLVMIGLGAASLKNRTGAAQLSEYGAFADVIICSVRWEILTSNDSAPPAQLWVAQALLLVEFYEKLYSARRFHERAHVYHSSFLTLLRRGSPLIGRTGSDSPGELESLDDRGAPGIPLNSHAWWMRWAETESMHRVVFAAFMLDIIHAAIFGHQADMAAHEIRLPLPCDDNLWAANSPDEVRHLEANFRMYGFKQVTFLDGLKSALHGKEVKTHSFGRMIIISGLLSVGWHLSHRETHLKWLDLRTPSTDVQDNWRKILLLAFDKWKGSFDMAMSGAMAESPAGQRHHHQLHLHHQGGGGGAGAGGGPQKRGLSNGPIHSAELLFHLAHMTLNVDIIDCQVYAGVKWILGRKVSARDYANAMKRMEAWAQLGSSRHATYHSFQLLCRVLVEPDSRGRRRPPSHASLADAADRSRAAGAAAAAPVPYSVRDEPDPHRPWVMYFAVLTIWSFVQALGRSAGKPLPLQSPDMGSTTHGRMAEYLSRVAALPELDERSAGMLHEGLPDLLDVMIEILEEASTELLVEARDRLCSVSGAAVAERSAITHRDWSGDEGGGDDECSGSGGGEEKETERGRTIIINIKTNTIVVVISYTSQDGSSNSSSSSVIKSIEGTARHGSEIRRQEAARGLRHSQQVAGNPAQPKQKRCVAAAQEAVDDASRRIKCDEAKPACKRCALTGRECAYDESGSGNSSSGSPPVSSPRRRGSSSSTASSPMTTHSSPEMTDLSPPKPTKGFDSPDWGYREGFRYFATVMVPMHHYHNPGDSAYEFSYDFKEFFKGIPDPNSFILVVLNHHIQCTSAAHHVPAKYGQLSALSPVWERLFDQMGIAISNLNGYIAYNQNPFFVLHRVADLMSVELALSLPSWRAHAEGYGALIEAYGGIQRLFQLKHKPTIITQFVLITSTMCNSTSPANDQIRLMSNWTDQEIAMAYSHTGFHSLPCPTPVFQAMIRITHLRTLVAANNDPSYIAELVPLAREVFFKIQSCRPDDWQEPYSTKNDFYPLAGELFQMAVALYGILSLPPPLASVFTYPPTDRAPITGGDWYYEARTRLQSLPARATYRAHLFQLFKKALPAAPAKEGVIWPAAVLGVAFSNHDEEEQTYIREYVEKMRWLPGSDGGAFHLLDKLEEFWASGKTAWDQCYYEPINILT